jgi:hypothetical protein
MTNQPDQFIDERTIHDKREWGIVVKEMESRKEYEPSTPSDTKEYNQYYKGVSEV